MRRLSKVEIKSLKKFYQKLADCRNLVLSTKWFDVSNVYRFNDGTRSIFNLDYRGGKANA